MFDPAYATPLLKELVFSFVNIILVGSKMRAKGASDLPVLKDGLLQKLLGSRLGGSLQPLHLLIRRPLASADPLLRRILQRSSQAKMC